MFRESSEMHGKPNLKQMGNELFSLGTAVRTLSKIAAVSMAFGLMTANPSWSQEKYPERTITGVNPFAPGGSTSIIGRLIFEEMGKTLGQSIVMENRPGAAANIGTSYVARAAPDGYTILYTSLLQYTLGYLIDANLPFDAENDLVPISVPTSAPVLLISSKQSGIKSIADLVEKSRDPAAKLKCGSSGIGASGHMVCVGLMDTFGGTATHVPYGGIGPQILALLAGDIDFIIEVSSSTAQYIRSGEMNAVAVLSSERLQDLPDIPTIGEQGYPQFSNWKTHHIMFAPKGTPAEIIEKLSDAAQKAVQAPELRKRLLELGTYPVEGSTPEAARKLLHDQFDIWRSPVEKSGLARKK
jgi:tripartite-type tricarboxylate transporter receptor subunit TctC